MRVCGLGIVLKMNSHSFLLVSLMASAEIEVSQTLSRPLACLLLVVSRELPAKILSGLLKTSMLRHPLFSKFDCGSLGPNETVGLCERPGPDDIFGTRPLGCIW